MPSSGTTNMSNVVLLPKPNLNVSEQLEHNKLNGWPDVSPQMKVFCHEWIATFSIDKARKACNLSRERAAEALRNPIILGYADELTALNRQDSILRREWVELEFLGLYDKCIGNEEVPHVTRDGDMVMSRDFNANASLGVLKEIAKIAKAYPAGDGHMRSGVTVNIDLGNAGYDSSLVPVTVEIADADFEEVE